MVKQLLIALILSLGVVASNATGSVHCPADLDGDDMVGTEDILSLFAQWGTDGPADLDGSGTVAINDLLVLFANWGLCPPIVGACCIYGAGCMMLTEAECIEQAGVFLPDMECKDGPYGPYCPYGYGYGSFAQLFGQQRPSFAFAALFTVIGLIGFQMAVAGKRS